MSFLDEVSPRFIGEDRLKLTLVAANAFVTLRAFEPVVLDVDYQAALPEGVVLPLEFSVTAPDGSEIARRVYRRFPPPQVAFIPRSGGSFLVRLSEQWHNRWWGKLVVEISGDRLRVA